VLATVPKLNVLLKILIRITNYNLCNAREFPTLREEHRLRVFENRVLRRIFRPKREVVTGGFA
jgi:hypothetical protein